MFGEAKVQAKEERDSCSSNNTDLCKCTCIQKLKQQNEFQKLHRKVQEKRALFFIKRASRQHAGKHTFIVLS